MKEFKPNEYEINILKSWDENKIYAKSKEKNKDKKPFYFLQGPPYTSGRLHMGHAWNNSLKDIVIRYKRMKGFDVWNRAGYDMHGLPTARKVQEKFKLDSKDDIEKFGMDRFAKECQKFSKEMAGYMNDDLKRLGIDMDFENAYLPIEKDYIEGVWWLIKQANNNNRLYEGLRTTSWCASCQTALAKHEQEYQEIKDNSIFVKFPLKGKNNESLVIWTTTPWTITYNLAVMIHPDFDYVKAEVIENLEGSYNTKVGEKWIVAKELLHHVAESTKVKLNIVEEFKGKDIEALEYLHPWQDQISDFAEIKKDSPKTHTVLMTEEYCTLETGSGLVHCAPGCGPEDYEVGYQNNIPPYNNIDDSGKIPKGMGKFSGLGAKKDDIEFIKIMKEYGMLIGKKSYNHDYAHCERCHNPVVFKTTKQWFFKVEDIKEKMIEFNKNVHWVPKTGFNAFNSWLENLRDNSITKQRFWGTPIPLWKCDDEECGNYVVVESADELKNLGAENIPDDLHKPWIDKCTLKCQKCGKTMHRLPDVLDVWIDAGCASWNCLYYPKRKDFFDKFFPADFILEAREQVRGWFNLLMVAGIIALDRPTFKAVYMHGMLTDVDGVKMSKSLGNVISPYELVDKYGADTLRLYMSETSAGEDINFAWDEADLRFRNLKILWNVHSFLINLYKDVGVKPNLVTSEPSSLEDKFILSKMHTTIKQLTHHLDNYELDKMAPLVQDLFLELSRTYIKFVRDKSSSGNADEKKQVMDIVYTVLMNNLKLMAPLTPLVADQIYQNLISEIKGLKSDIKESVHLEKWPEYNEDLISDTIEKEVFYAQEIIGGILSARDKAGIGVRWPLSKVIVDVAENEEAKLQYENALKNMNALIKEQTNIKEIELKKVDVDISIKPNFRAMGKEFGEHTATVVTYIKGKEDKIAEVIKSDKKYSFKAESKTVDVVKGETIQELDFELSKDHFIIERVIPKQYSYGEIKNASVYLIKIMTPELEAEGFAREIVRRVQALRKEAGLEKSDEVELCIVLPIDIKDNIAENIDDMKQKIGARKISYVSENPNEKYQHTKVAKVKGKEFVVNLNKL